MTPEELVKQLRLSDRIHIGRMMRDAADMIDRLRAELAESENLRRFADMRIERDRARIARVRELADQAGGEPSRLFRSSEIYASIEGNQP